MTHLKITNFLAFLAIISIRNVNCDRTKDRIYNDIRGASACFKRMNATHQTGCTSDREGSTGIIHLTEELIDLQTLLKDGTGQSYIPLVPIDILNEKLVLLLKTSSKISGLLVYKDNETTLSNYSHEDKCPNREFNNENTCQIDWNIYGTNILNENFNFPIFYVTNDTDLKNLKDCFFKFNNGSIETHNVRSLCSVELSSFMLAAIDTPTCLRRSSPFFNLNAVKLCDPLGSSNVWASLFPMGNFTFNNISEKLNENDEKNYEKNNLQNNLQQNNKKSEIIINKNMKYIIVTSRLDTTSLFSDQEKGAINPISSLVTLLYTARDLKKLLPTYENNYEKNVIFLLLSGESYDYIGSQRFIYDLKTGVFPTTDFSNKNESIQALNPEDIYLVIELNQLSKFGEVFVHVNDKKPEINEFINKLQKNKNDFKINVLSERLPPSSLQTFTKENISGLVLTDHKDIYSNKYYNSMLDDSKNINYEYYKDINEIPKGSIQDHVSKLGGILANTLYEEITGKVANKLPQDLNLPNELFNCYLKDTKCKIHNAVAKKIPSTMSFYVGVSVSRPILPFYVGLTLSWLTGDVVNQTSPCQPKMNSYLFKYYNMSKSLEDLNTTVCYRSCMNLTEAVSPAFIIKDYDWSSNEYSSWTESVWKELSVRMFLRPSPGHEKMTLAIGSMVMALSFILVYFVSSRSSILFAGVQLTAPTRC